jgi:phosphohistidine phosphatase
MAAEMAYNPNLILINDLLYDAPARTFLHELQNLDPRLTAALVVGHNPSVTEVVNLLTGLQNSYIPAGGCTYITFEASDWHLIEWSDIKYMINYT